jgi:hypothetical protein
MSSSNSNTSGISRRRMLAGLGLGSLSAMAGSQVFAAGPAAAKTATPLAPGVPAALAARTAAAPPAVPHPAPGDFSVRASCDLTEDYFLTSEIVLNVANGDRVLPFVNPLNGNAVEAIVFVQGVNGGPGTVSHLARNSAVASGWTYTQIGLSGTVPWPMDVAVAADGSAVYIMVLAEPNTGDGPAWLSKLDSATSWNSGYVASYDDLGFKDLPISPPATFGPLKGGVDQAAGNAYFYASVAVPATTYLIGWVAGDGWESGNFNYQLLQALSIPSDMSIVDYIVLFDTTASAKPVGYSLVLDSGTYLTGYRQLPYTSQDTPQFTDSSQITDLAATAVTELIWAWATPGSNTGLPGYAYQQEEDEVDGIAPGTVFCDESGHKQTLSDQATLGKDAVAIWLDSGLYTVNLLDPSDTLSTTAQYDSGSGPVWGAAVPIGVGLTGVFSVPTDPSQATLFAVDPGGVLNVLTKGATGWTQNVVHQEAASTIEVVTWRCQIGLYDSSGATVGPNSGSVQLSTSLPIDIWQANSSIVLLPGTPVTLPLGTGGQTSVAIPTAELDTALLTATPLDANGKPNGPALPIVPNTDTRNYLAGTGSLTSAGGTTLSGASLTSAQDKVWDSTTQTYVPQGALMPVLAKAGASAANQVAQGITHVMSLPTSTPGSGDTQAALLDLTGSTPSFQTSSNPAAFDSHKTGATSWWDKAKHDIDSVFRGLRHAAISVGKMISTWAADAKQWTINLIVDLGDGIDQLMSWVVTGIEDAYHAVSSFFHSLGTDIKGIWNWLKNLVLSALRDAGANAKYIESWAGTLVDTLISGINDFEAITDDQLTAWQGDVSGWLTELQDQVDTVLFGTYTQQPTPAPGTGGDDSGSHFTGAQDIFHFLAHSPASWLLNKIMADIKPIEGSALASIQVSNFSSFASDLANDVDDAVDTIIDAATTIADALGDAAQSVAGFNAQSMNQLFTQFQNLSSDIFKLLKSLANTVLDLLKAFIESLNDMLTAEFQPPFIGEVLHLAGVDNTPSIQHLAALIIAFPATLLHALSAAALGGAGQPLFPFDAPASDAAGGRDPDWAGFGLGEAASVTQTLWATVDLFLELGTYDSGESSTKDPLLDIFTALDILCPILITIFQWPVPPTYTGTQTPAPFHYNDFTDGSVWGTWYHLLPGIFIAGGVPWLIEAIGWILGKFAPAPIPQDQADNFNNNIVPGVQTLASATDLILSAWYSYSNAANAGTKAEAIIGPIISNLSYLDAAVAAQKMQDAVGKNIVWLKFYIDLFGNYATAFIDMTEAIAAAAK